MERLIVHVFQAILSFSIADLNFQIRQVITISRRSGQIRNTTNH